MRLKTPQKKIQWQQWLALSASLLVTALLVSKVLLDIQKDITAESTAESNQIALRIRERIKSYSLTVRGAAALFNASAHGVTRKEWEAYTSTMMSGNSVPGVFGIGYALIVQPGELDAHIRSVRSEGFPEFTVYPKGKRDLYTSIIYIEPFSGLNLRAFGYDMYSEPVRREAMERARDTGQAALSGKVKLVQETEKDVQSGTLVYVPVYRKKASLKNVAERRAAIVGWAYSPYRMNDLMDGILGKQKKNIDRLLSLKIYSGDRADPEALLYVNNPEADWANSTTQTIELHGQKWLLVFSEVHRIFGAAYLPAWIAGVAGLLVTALLYILTTTILSTRFRAERIAHNLTEKIKNSREKLKESEYRWRYALEGAGDGLWDWNVPDSSVYFSKRWKEMLGFAENELGNSLNVWSDRIHPDDKEETLRIVKEYLEGKSDHYHSEHRVQCKDGSYKWILDRGIIVKRDKDGHPVRIIGTHTDITARKQLEQKLMLSEKELKEAQRIARIGNWHMNVATNHVYWSPELFRMLGLDPNGTPPDYTEHMKLFTPESWDRLSVSLARTRDTGVPYELELEMVRADGSHGIMLARGEAVYDNNNVITDLHGIAADITEQKAAEEKLHLAASVFTHTREGIVITDPNGIIIEVNDAFSQITGYTRQEIIGKSPNVLKSGQHDKNFYQLMWQTLNDKGHWSGEIRNRKKNGEFYTEMLTISVVRDGNGNVLRYVGLFSDISVIKEHQKQLENIAHFDALTGLPNRFLLADRLRQSMLQTAGRGQQLAVAYIDLDGFKRVNDTYGHDIGDKLLVKISDRMRHTMRDGDTFARLGGDEFVAVLPNVSDQESAAHVLDRILDALREPANINSLELTVSASIGVSFYPQVEEIDAEQLLRQADQAMYHAKVSGKNRFSFFDAELDKNLRVFHESLEGIREAIKREEFVLYYQPKINMATGALVGAEALVRWQHPEKGLLAPGTFLPVIENHPLGIELSEWIIDQTLRQIKSWQNQSLIVQVSINIMAIHLRKKNFTASIKNAMQNYPDIDAAQIQLEILETSALGDLAQISEIIEDFRRIGVTFALDDFGTGYSSLTYLKTLNADILKIDQSFIREMLDDSESLAIIEGVIGLARAFRRQVIAEGVETLEHGKLLLRLGCEQAQGYAIARPMPADQFMAWLSAYKLPTEWRNIGALSGKDRPLLYARAEHLNWAHKLEHYIKGQISARPVYDTSMCRIGSWLHDGDATGIFRFEKKNALLQLHDQIHSDGQEIIESYERGKAEVALEKLAGLRQHIEDFCAHLHI